MRISSVTREPRGSRTIERSTASIINENASFASRLCGGPASSSGRAHSPPPQSRKKNVSLTIVNRPQQSNGLIIHSVEAEGKKPQSPVSIKRAKQLTAAIRKCEEWVQLRQLLLRSKDINHIHICAVICALPRMVPRPIMLEGPDQKELREFFKWLCLQVTQECCLSCMGARELSNVLGAAAKLGLHPGYTWISNIVDAAYNHMQSHSGQDCGSTAWALAKMGFHPSPTWSIAFVTRCQAVLPDMDSQALSNLLWAFARWDYTPPRELLHCAAQSSAATMHSLSPQGLSNVLWAFARLGYQPTAHWMATYWDCVYEAALSESISVQELSSILFAAGKLGCHLPDVNLQLVEQQLAGQCCELSFSGAAYAMWGLSMMRCKPRQPLMEAWYNHTQQLLQDYAAKDVMGTGSGALKVDGMSFANALHAVQRIESLPVQGQCEGDRVLVPDHWLQAAVQASVPLMAGMDERALAVSGLCLAKLEAKVDKHWAVAYASAVQLRLGTMNSAEVTNVLCAMSRLQQLPDTKFLYQLLAHVLEEFLRCKPNELANSLLALAHLSKGVAATEPGEAWMSLCEGLWGSLKFEAQGRWMSLPPSSITANDVKLMRKALLLARQDVSWLKHLGSRVIMIK